jgi:Phage integrase family
MLNDTHERSATTTSGRCLREGRAKRIEEKTEFWALRQLRRENLQSRYVFNTERGAPVTRAWFLKLLNRLSVVAKLPFQAHPHMLRHACGFKLANDGVDTRALQHFMGHRNIQHTVRYTELALFNRPLDNDRTGRPGDRQERDWDRRGVEEMRKNQNCCGVASTKEADFGSYLKLEIVPALIFSTTSSITKSGTRNHSCGTTGCPKRSLI